MQATLNDPSPLANESRLQAQVAELKEQLSAAQKQAEEDKVSFRKEIDERFAALGAKEPEEEDYEFEEIEVDEEDEEEKDQDGMSDREAPDDARDQSTSSPRPSRSEPLEPSKKYEKKRGRSSVSPPPEPEEDEDSPPEVKRRQKLVNNSEILDKVMLIVEQYLSSGVSVIQKLFAPLSQQQVKANLLMAMGRDKRGFRSEMTPTKEERKWISLVQELVMQQDESIRKPLTSAILMDVFGIRKFVDDMLLWEKVNLIALCGMDVSLSEKQMQEIIRSKAKAVAAMTSASPWARVDVQDLEGGALQSARLNDVVKNPTKWREWIFSSPEVASNRRELLEAISRKYKLPHELRRNDRIIMNQCWEIRRNLWEIETILSLPKDSESEVVRECHEALLLYKVERLEALKLYLKDPKIATEFSKLADASPPSKTKNLTELREKAEKKAKEVKRTFNLKDLGTLAHTSRSISSQKASPQVFLSTPPSPSSQRSERERSMSRQRSARPFQPFRRDQGGKGPPRPPKSSF